ncbi:MAG: ABC transporter ATP-binding protein [archaeon]|nr:ABC transporter ATP-binding protein [archaeon]
MKGILADSIGYKYSKDTQALKNISLHVQPGEIIGIMGRNGAGKSTFMKLVNGLLNPTSGTMYVDGISTDLYKSSDLTRKVGVMFQNPEHQLFSSTVEEEINYSLNNLELSKVDFQKYKNDIIDRLDLGKFLEFSPFNLSGGERKKVSIATILCRKPKYLLFDEPTIGQDKKQRKMLENIINEEKIAGNTIIIITHDTEFAYNNVDRIIVFERGSILADGPTKEILSNEKILEESSLIPPQISNFKNVFKKLWKKEHINIENPINFEEIENFSYLSKKIINILEEN